MFVSLKKKSMVFLLSSQQIIFVIKHDFCVEYQNGKLC